MGKDKRHMDETTEVPKKTKPSLLRSKWFLIASGTLAVAAIVAVTFMVNQDPDEKFISRLVSAGLADTYSSEKEAITSAKDFCWDLKSGSPNQGQQPEEIAVQVYCPEYSKEFRLLKLVKVRGSLTVTEEGDMKITRYGSACSAQDGFQYLASWSNVVVLDKAGETLASTDLETGVLEDGKCKFNFTFELLQGASQYRIRIGYMMPSEITEESFSDGVLDLWWNAD